MTDFPDHFYFNQVSVLLDAFYNLTVFVTTISGLNGHILSHSGRRKICTEFHCKNHQNNSDCHECEATLAINPSESDPYRFYQCLNGLVSVFMPIVVRGIHVANLSCGHIFLEDPDIDFFKRQAKKYDFYEDDYLKRYLKFL